MNSVNGSEYLYDGMDKARVIFFVLFVINQSSTMVYVRRVQVWELRGMDHTVSPQSRATYSSQTGRLLDLCMVDNSHSVASASSDGTVHVRA